MYEPITLDISPLGVLTDEVLYQRRKDAEGGGYCF